MSTVYIGLISGTSADAIDAIAVDIGEKGKTTQVAALAFPLADTLREKIFAVQTQKISLAEIGELDTQLGESFANAAIELIELNKIDKHQIHAIGSHGQTVLHQPESAYPNSLQLGNPNIIVERSGITTVADFRRRDLAAGGQGAPLVPAFHQSWLNQQENTIVLNMGGIANISVLSDQGTEPLLGFDTGPANTLLDAWTRLHLNKAYDDKGTWAKEGNIHAGLLDSLLKHPFFRKIPPKSADINQFSIKWLENFLRMFPDMSSQDVATTLVELSATSITNAIAQWAQGTDQVIACGGGCKNTFLMQRLADHLNPINLLTSDKFGIGVDWVEATAFAWLAQQTLRKQPGNAPRATGANHTCILGGVYYA